MTRTLLICVLVLAGSAMTLSASEALTAAELARVLGVRVFAFDVPQLTGEKILVVWVERWARGATTAQIRVIENCRSSFKQRIVVRLPSERIPELTMDAPPGTSTSDATSFAEMTKIDSVAGASSISEGPDGTLLLIAGCIRSGGMVVGVGRDQDLGEALARNEATFLIRARIFEKGAQSGPPTAAAWNAAEKRTIYTW